MRSEGAGCLLDGAAHRLAAQAVGKPNEYTGTFVNFRKIQVLMLTSLVSQ